MTHEELQRLTNVLTRLDAELLVAIRGGMQRTASMGMPSIGHAPQLPKGCALVIVSSDILAEIEALGVDARIAVDADGGASAQAAAQAVARAASKPAV